MSFHHHHRQYFAHATTSHPCRCNFLGSLQTGILALKCTSTANLPRYWKHRHCEWVVGNLTTSPLPHMCHKYPSIADDDCLIKDWEVEEDEVTRQLIKLVNLIFTNPSQCHYRVVVDGGSSQRFILAAAADWLTDWGWQNPTLLANILFIQYQQSSWSSPAMKQISLGRLLYSSLIGGQSVVMSWCQLKWEELEDEFCN